VVLLAGGVAVAQTEGLTVVWSQFQGGPQHLGVAAVSTLVPPLEEVWRFDDPSGEVGLSSPVLVGGLTIAVGADRVLGLDVATGEEEFSVGRARGPLADPAVGEVEGQTILVYTQGEGELTEAAAVDLATRDSLWKVQIGAGSRSGVTALGDRAFVGDREGVLHALDLATGQPLWAYRGAGEINSPVAAGEGLVVAVFGDPSAGEAGAVALDPETGDVIWTYTPPLRSPFASAPSLLAGGVIVGFADGVRALSAESGTELWRTRTRSPISPSSAVAVAGGAVYAADVSAGLYRLDEATGVRAWDFQFDELTLRGAPAIVGGTAFLGLQDGRLAAVDIRSGHQVWEADTGTGSLGAIAVGPETLVVKKGGARGGLVAFRNDPTGTLLDISSPTDLDLPGVLRDFGLAFLAVFGVLFLLFRFLLRRVLPPAPGTSAAPRGNA
jgi:outer membrane protein assembly factor BamB